MRYNYIRIESYKIPSDKTKRLFEGMAKKKCMLKHINRRFSYKILRMAPTRQ